MNNQEYIKNYLEGVKNLAEQILPKDIEAAIQLLYEAWKSNRQVFIAGNGGSASTATHFAGDLAKFTSVSGKKRFRSICLNDNIPLVSALTNDLGWENVYVEQLMNLMQRGDVFVPISVHGGSGADSAGLWSQNLLKAAKFVQKNGGKVVGLAGFDGGAMKQIADACIVVPVNSTSYVEGFHAVLTHLICARLHELIGEQ
jgi:D-sedoheptulose 7-phosphate isomerase